MTQHPTYLLAPSFRFKPGTGPIALGNIIADPLRPHRALTTVDAEALKTNYPRVETITDHDYSINRSVSRDVSLAIWAQFLQTVSAKVSGEQTVGVHTNYTMRALETNYFVTDPQFEEIQARIKAPRVQAILKASNIPGFRHPVYMITGLMVAKGFAAVHEKGRHRAGELTASGDIPTPAGDVGLGASVASSAATEQSDMWNAGEDIVFAYQLLKIEVKGWRGRKVEYDEFQHKAAFLSREEEESEDEEVDTEDQVALQITACATTAENLPVPRGIEGIKAMDFGDGESKITCISAFDS